MRLIDADALMEKGWETEDEGCFNKTISVVSVEDIDNAPTIDAVEVVRCRDCEHWICNPNTEEWGKCKWISDEQFDVVMNADDFCSYGNREGE